MAKHHYYSEDDSSNLSGRVALKEHDPFVLAVFVSSQCCHSTLMIATPKPPDDQIPGRESIRLMKPLRIVAKFGNAQVAPETWVQIPPILIALVSVIG